jgi:hypothetical protein
LRATDKTLDGVEGKNRVIITRFDIGVVLPFSESGAGFNELENASVEKGKSYLCRVDSQHGDIEKITGKSASDDVGALLPFFVPIFRGSQGNLAALFLFSSTTP